MPTYKLTDKKAKEYLTSNRFARWYKAGADVNDTSGTLATQRMKHKYFPPGLNIPLSIQRSDKIFTMGSCFARGLEATLIGHGFCVESVSKEFDQFELLRSDGTGLGFTNKYTTYAILNELTWALDSETEFPVNTIVEIDSGNWIDPHMNPTLKFVDKDTTILRRNIFNSVMKRIAHCRIIVITLGLIECWHDDWENVFINMAPTGEMSSRYPGRYSFHVINCAENKKNLDEMYALLSSYGHDEFQIIVTVSPVPLMATFTDRDVVIANTLSKSTLRVVAEEWAASHSNVHYFPSYEIVMNSDKSCAWTEDGRHVQPEMARYIMGLLLDNCAKF